MVSRIDDNPAGTPAPTPLAPVPPPLPPAQALQLANAPPPPQAATVPLPAPLPLAPPPPPPPPVNVGSILTGIVNPPELNVGAILTGIVNPAITATGGDGGTAATGAFPVPDAADWPDAESGDGDFTDDDYAALVNEADALDAGRITLDAVTHPKPGTIIGEPYVGSHAVAFNRAGGSDNWESENAVDIWLYPGTHILAVEDGIVSPGGWGYGLSASGGRFAGWRVHLVGASGRVFYYTHMAGLNVLKAQRVSKGHHLGDSGVANGVPHLHFAVNIPYDPHAWAKLTYDLKARTSIGTSPVTGEPPYKPADVNSAWRDLIDVFSTDVPAQKAKVDARADMLLGVFK